MEDTHTLIKELIDLDILENINNKQINKELNKDNLEIFKNKCQQLPEDTQNYIIQHTLSKIKDFTLKIQLLTNIDFINMFTDNSQLISTIIIYTIKHSYPHKKKLLRTYYYQTYKTCI
jgi:hypothetical protein